MNTEELSTGMTRRAFLGATAAVTALALRSDPSAAEVKPAPRPRALIDVNIHLFRWPWRRLPGDETTALVAKLRRHGLTQAWAGSFEGLLHKDLGAVNLRLARECRRHGHGLLLPFGAINPKAPDWEEELRRCAEVHRMPGIRLYPSYHGFTLDDPDFVQLLRRATDYRLVVQLVLAMEDERTLHPLLRVDPLNPAPLAAMVRQTPGLRLVLLNAWRVLSGAQIRQLLGAGEVSVDIATLEGVGGLARLVDELPPHRLLFGSHAPFFYLESALLKLQESPLGREQLKALRADNALRLLAS